MRWIPSRGLGSGLSPDASDTPHCDVYDMCDTTHMQPEAPSAIIFGRFLLANERENS